MLYSYIKIPGIANSESTDEYYGKEWIPLKSVKLSGETNESDPVHQSVSAYYERKKKAQRKQQKPAAAETTGAQDAKTAPPADDATPGLRDSKIPPPPPLPDPPPLARARNPYDSDIMGDDSGERKAGGSIEITKMFDATSPKLHLICLKSLQCESDEYIDGKIEIHICRQIPDPNKKDASSLQIYMGYIMENCLITGLDFDASESSNLTETVTISFEKISSCIKIDGKNWDSQGWDFTSEKTMTPAVPLRPVPKK